MLEPSEYLIDRRWWLQFDIRLDFAFGGKGGRLRHALACADERAANGDAVPLATRVAILAGGSVGRVNASAGWYDIGVEAPA